ncbi:aminotransferase class V-fold PLP-dependent enzyme [Frigoribacterium sp. CG_9.8]|uniref:aminotransferase class V-fold PLP-dependent enzyme n=1 Tax=Frigoribacterium sp. CG_9.8 TaxID=2787733 RepID=UPI0018C9685B|nr:aminotransferase class V-fold PLP-dependent enzyme [Frigoribacterium sp. CG_9.8]MBG6107449.1 selenocysteine lyase/cysteine desulfurase [Frigoribacterium sp. CG_9.8]
MTTIDDFCSGFAEEAGYLDFASFGPLGRAAIEEQLAVLELMRRARFGSLASLFGQDARVRAAVGTLTGFPAEQVVLQPNTGSGLMQAMFGITGGVLLSATEFPALPVAAVRAADALSVLVPHWLDTDGGPVTPGVIRDQLAPSIVAVAVSLVDVRTGYLADLEGIRQVIGDRLLIVDATQGFGIVDAPFHLADIVASGGQTWVRAGWGTGFLALSERALERLTPVFSGPAAMDSCERDSCERDSCELTDDGVAPPARDAAAYSIGRASPIDQARFAAALEEIGAVSVPAISARLAEKVSRVIDLADEFALPVASSRAENQRAGIIVLEPAADQLTPLTASLFNHGITATTIGGTVRLSPHVSTTEETFAALRGAFISYASTITV